MQHHARELLRPDLADPASAICVITKNGMTHRTQMDPELMGSSRLRIEEDVRRHLSIAPIDIIFGDGGLWFRRTNRKFLPFSCITADGEFNTSAALLRHAPDERFIRARDTMLFKLCRKPPRRARSVFATTITPDVSLSNRWTKPGALLSADR